MICKAVWNVFSRKWWVANENEFIHLNVEGWTKRKKEKRKEKKESLQRFEELITLQGIAVESVSTTQ